MMIYGGNTGAALPSSSNRRTSAPLLEAGADVAQVWMICSFIHVVS
jgi:hypothetical protein